MFKRKIKRKIKQAKKNPRLDVTCSSCGEVFVMDETAVHKRPCAVEEWIDEIGLVCPHCSYWQHVMLDTAALRRLKNSQLAKLQAYQQARTERAARAYNKAKHKHKAAYNRFHAEWRPKLGLVAPGELLKEDMIGAADSEEE